MLCLLSLLLVLGAERPAQASPATPQHPSTAPADLHMQLDARRELAMDLPYNFQQIIGTHNSWNIHTLANNQERSVTEQLDLGARYLDIDVYPTIDGLYLCHGACYLDVLQGLNPFASFTDNVKLDDFFQEIRQWLDDNPREIISFQVEDPNGVIASDGEFQGKLTAYFGSRWLRQADRFTYFPDWDEHLWPTPRQLLAGCQGSGCSAPGVGPKQLLVATFNRFEAAALISEKDHQKPFFSGHDFGKDSNTDPSFPAKASSLKELDCYKNRQGIPDLYSALDPQDLDYGDMLAFDDDKPYWVVTSPDGVICARRGKAWITGALADCIDIPSLLRCDANVVATDRFAEDMARASVHTWAPGYPTLNTAQNCAVMSAEGTLSDAACGAGYRFFCTYGDGNHAFLSHRLDVWSNGEAVCAAEKPGGHFRGPMKVSQYWQLEGAIRHDWSTSQLWVNLTDQGHEGVWTAATDLAGTVTSDSTPPFLWAECPQSDTSVHLSWANGPNDAATFILERSLHGSNAWTQLLLAPSGPGDLVDEGLTAGLSYDYRIRAVLGGITTYSNVEIVLAQRPVDSVDGLHATITSPGVASLAWTIPADNNIDHYEIYRADSYATALYPTLVAGNVSAGARVSYDDTSAPPNNDRLYYKVVAVNGSCKGRSEARTVSEPVAPSDLFATVMMSGQNRVRLTFTDRSFNEEVFVIYRQKDGGEAVEIATIPGATWWGTTLSYEDFPQEGNAAYTYRVSARHDLLGSNIESAPSAAASVTLGQVTRVLSLAHDYALGDVQGGEKVFRFDPVGAWVFNLQFLIRTLDGSVGDADIYVARGRIPTLSDYDCRPYTSASDEQCTIPAAQLNGWSNDPFYVMVRGYTPYISVELLVLQNMLHAGESSASFWMYQGTGMIFTFPDMPGTVSLGAASPAAYGDADLFAACGKVPFLDPATLGNYWAIPVDFEVASTGGSFTEAVTLPGNRGHGRPARCFGLVKGYTAYGNLKITAPAWNPG